MAVSVEAVPLASRSSTFKVSLCWLATSGPGLLCRAMEIDRRLNGHDLLSDELFIAEPEVAEKFTVVNRPRIGVDYAQHWAKRLLRFYIKDNPFVSRP